MNKAILLMVIMVVACSYSTLAAWNNTNEINKTTGFVTITNIQPYIDDFEYYNNTWSLNKTYTKNHSCNVRDIISNNNEFYNSYNYTHFLYCYVNAGGGITRTIYKNISEYYNNTVDIIVLTRKGTPYVTNGDFIGIALANSTDASQMVAFIYQGFTTTAKIVAVNYSTVALPNYFYSVSTPTGAGDYYYLRIIANATRVDYYYSYLHSFGKYNTWTYINGFNHNNGKPFTLQLLARNTNYGYFDNLIIREHQPTQKLNIYPAFVYRTSRNNDTNNTPTNFTFDWYNAKTNTILNSDTWTSFNNTYRNNYSYTGTKSEQMYLNITMCDELGCAWEVSQTLYNLTSAPPAPTTLCANISNAYVNISVGNENYPLTSLLNASFEAFGRTTISNNIDTYTLSWNGTAYNTSLYLCLNYTTFNATNTTFQITYQTDDGYKLRWYFNNINTSNCYNQTIYNFNTTLGQSELRLTLRNVNTYGYYPDLYVKLQRLYVGEGVWRSVQDDKSDNYGLTHYYIYETTTDYKLLIYDEYNRLLASSDSMKFACTASICSLTYLVEPYDETTSSSYDVDIDTSYNNATGIVSIAFTDALGDNVHFWWTVTRETLSGRTVVCNASTYAASGNLTCNISGLTGTFLITARTSKSPWTDRVREWLYVHSWPLRTLLGGDDAGIYVVLIMLAVVGFGIWSPSVAITMVTIGLILLYVLGMVSTITITLIIISFIMAIIVGVKIKR